MKRLTIAITLALSMLLILSFDSGVMGQRSGWGPGKSPNVKKDTDHMPYVDLEGGKTYEFCIKFNAPNNLKMRYHAIIYSDQNDPQHVYLERTNYHQDVCYRFDKSVENNQRIYVTLWRDNNGQSAWHQLKMKGENIPPGQDPVECDCSVPLQGSGSMITRKQEVRRKLSATTGGSDGTIIIMEK